MWIRRRDLEKWMAFRHTIQFARDIAGDGENWSKFVYCFCNLVGSHVILLPRLGTDRLYLFAVDATPD